MGRQRKDGKPTIHRGGRPKKEKQMELERRLQQSYQQITKHTKREGADAVLRGFWKIAMDDKHPKQYDALKWISERYYGKEPKAVLVQHEHNHRADFNIQEAIANAYQPKTIEIKHEEIDGSTNNKSDLSADTSEQGE